jgi:hypothetical protein
VWSGLRQQENSKRESNESNKETATISYSIMGTERFLLDDWDELVEFNISDTCYIS